MLRRKKIKIILKPLTGIWGCAYQDHNEIELDERMDDRTMLSTAPHEVLHILFPWLTEAAVDDAGEEIADLLWRLGFRRLEHGDE
jgi:hypothetical protein